MATADEITQFCPHCGLCCDSTLFADVELRAGDDAQKLRKAGLKLYPKTKTRLAFDQPCRCFAGRLCQIYPDRPKRCRAFDCGLLQRVADAELTPAAALKKITAAKQLADRVRELLRSLGQREEQMALTHRYAEAMAAPVDLADEAGAERHGKLMLAVNDLMTRLQRDFLR